MNVRYELCAGRSCLPRTADASLDFSRDVALTPWDTTMGTQVGALARELGRCGPAMIQTHAADLAGGLAEKLSQTRGRRLGRARRAFRA